MILTRLLFNPSQRIQIYQSLEDLLEVNVALDVALDEIGQGYAEMGIFGRIRAEEIGRWHRHLKAKNNLQAMSDVISTAEKLVLTASSKLTNPGSVLKATRKTLVEQIAVKKGIQKGAFIPCFGILLVITLFYAASTELIPALNSIIPIEEWKGLSSSIANISLFIHANVLFVFTFLGLIIALISFSLPNWTGYGRTYFDKFFPWSLYRLSEGSAFLLALSAIMNSGTGSDDDKTLTVLMKNASPYTRHRIALIRQHRANGLKLGDAMDKAGTNFPDRDIIRIIKLISKYGNFSRNLATATNNWTKRIIEKVVRASAVIGFVIMCSVVGSMISLLYGISDVINQIQGL